MSQYVRIRDMDVHTDVTHENKAKLSIALIITTSSAVTSHREINR
jgi:hypothetical protein